MIPLSIPDISLVPPSDMEEASRASATPELAQDIEGAVNIPEPFGQLPFLPVAPDPDTAFQFQSEFLGFGDDTADAMVTHWIKAIQRGGATPQWWAFVSQWQATMPGERKRYALFHLLIDSLRRLDLRLRPLALECFLSDGPDGRAAVQRNWKRIGLGAFAREHWAVVQRLLRDAGMLK